MNTWNHEVTITAKLAIKAPYVDREQISMAIAQELHTGLSKVTSNGIDGLGIEWVGLAYEDVVVSVNGWAASAPRASRVRKGSQV